MRVNFLDLYLRRASVTLVWFSFRVSMVIGDGAHAYRRGANVLDIL